MSRNRALQAFDWLHLDIWGPYSLPSVHQHRYFFLTIVDDISRFTWIVLLKGKSEVQKHVQNFISPIETRFESIVKHMCTDNGPEFHLPSFYASKGILHQKSCVTTPKQNTRVEGKHQYVLNVARALLFQSKLPKKFWGYAVQHAVYIINRVPSKVLEYKTPYELLHGQLPDLSDLRAFGCLCFVSTHSSHKTKFDPRSRRCVFIGYQAGMKGYIIHGLVTQGISVSRDVQFHELVFPYTPSHSSPSQPHWQ